VRRFFREQFSDLPTIMILPGKNPGSNICVLASILPFGLLVLLPGCASTSPQSQQSSAKEHVVIGQGTTDDRSVINTSSQQIFAAEHETSPDAPTSPNAANQNLP
jgi:hypothetical protein